MSRVVEVAAAHRFACAFTEIVAGASAKPLLLPNTNPCFVLKWSPLPEFAPTSMSSDAAIAPADCPDHPAYKSPSAASSSMDSTSRGCSLLHCSPWAAMFSSACFSAACHQLSSMGTILLASAFIVRSDSIFFALTWSIPVTSVAKGMRSTAMPECGLHGVPTTVLGFCRRNLALLLMIQ